VIDSIPLHFSATEGTEKKRKKMESSRKGGEKTLLSRAKGAEDFSQGVQGDLKKWIDCQ
jgi:hypothetical protein